MTIIFCVTHVLVTYSISITNARKASMEQTADLYAMENTIEATASTSRNTGSRNSNEELFA